MWGQLRGQGTPCPSSDWSVLDRCGDTGASMTGHARSFFPVRFRVRFDRDVIQVVVTLKYNSHVGAV